MEFAQNTIEELLSRYKISIGVDFGKYRNHVYRVFLNCILIDTDKSNEEKYAIAAVFHDIGIWTDSTIDYLKPSIAQMEKYLQENNTREWSEEIALMIYWHHKTSAYRGMHSRTVETFRKADWIDVSLGWINFGIDKKMIRSNRRAFQNLGFHVFLLRKIIRNFFRHPFSPLPMFTR